MSIIERDIVTQGVDKDGNETIDFPLARLGWIEDTAPVKAATGASDYVPIVDMDDGGQMKKILAKNLLVRAEEAYDLASETYDLGAAVAQIANNAKTAAGTAQTTANDAKTAASTAQSTANTAKTAASNAQSRADSAYSLANGKPSLLSCWPVNSIYISYSHTSPASLFGGSWTRIEGRFLFGTGTTGTIGNMGGETQHTLVSTELPAHAHYGIFYTGSNGSVTLNTGSYGYRLSWTSSAGKGVDELRTGFTGSNVAHNNMPPFINVAVWRRTA